MLMLTFILLILTIFSSCSSGIIDERKCIHKDNVTVTCNHIPVDILPRISKVRIADIHFVTDKVPVIINQINFTSRSWSRVEYLEINDLEQGFNGNWRFEDNCFGSLKALKELHIHILYLKIFEGTFIGLNKVTVLDLSDCARLKRNILLPALNGTYKLPKLQKLLLRNWNSYNLPYGFDETFVQTLLPRKVTHLDISSTHISLLNYSSIFKNLRFLEIINISYANIEEVLYREPEVNGPEVNGDEMKHVRVFDLSYPTLPRQFMSFVPAVLSLSNININFSRLEGDFDAFLSTAESFNFSGIIPQYTSIYIELMKLTIDVEVKWSVKDLILRQNNLKSLDIQCFCDNYTFSSIEELDISDNGLEFIHPTFLYCMSNVEKINLAKNRLFKMRNGNRTVFEKLFLELNYLKYITLSANGLYDIPFYTFTKCRNIEVIDLSNNRLNQVTFILNGLERLQILDLQNNRIKMLDKISINRLNFLWAGNKSNEFKAIIVLRSNPLSCSDCSTKSFIKWLTSQMSSALVKQNLTCTSENENKEIITEQTRSIVQKICDREAMIISSAVSTAGLVSVVIILA
ncbi:toll-like receptor 3 [Mercenaria mercenaria]|uniref:toll-like receptor 3 n=1 Tax=Mercenaria mercenaria TaxID=6596 RepID=UPI00234E8F03|nr:toll-like receptor 3 [Mercenaria mercenaria]